jgi:hypothetical protein
MLETNSAIYRAGENRMTGLTLILRLLHMPHPRLGFPVYTIVGYK